MAGTQYEIAFRLGARIDPSLRSAMTNTVNNVNRISSSIQTAQRSSISFSGSLGQLASLAAKAYGAFKIADITKDIVKMGIAYDQATESSQVAWTTLLGNSQKAKDMILQISNFAKNTQFDTAGVDAMAKYMNNAGYSGKALFNQLNEIADVSGAFNISADNAKEMARQMSQVVQSGTAFTEDLNILQDRGVPIYKELAKVSGITVQQVRKAASMGTISSKEYMKAFDNIAKSVKGASAKQAQTFSGMISTLKDDFAIMSGILAKPIFNVLHQGLTNLMPLMDGLTSFARGDFKSFRASLNQTFGSQAAGMISNFVQKVSSGISTAKQAVTGIFDIAKGGASEGTGISILDNLGISSKTTLAIQNFVSGAKSAFSGLWADFQKGTNFLQQTFGPIISDVGNTMATMFAKVNWTKVWTDIQQIAGYIGQTFKPTLQDMVSVFKSVWDAATAPFTSGGGMGIVQGTLDGIKSIFEWTAKNSQLVEAALFGIGGAFAAFKILNGINKGMATFRTLMIALRTQTLLETAAQLGLNLAMLANPMTWVVVGIGALIAAGVLLYKNWDTVKTKMSSIWTSIQVGAAKMVNGVISGINWMIKLINKIPGVNIPLIGGVYWGGSTKAENGGGIDNAGTVNGAYLAAHKYAYGTNGHPGGLALVGDGKGSNSGRELMMFPNGRLGLSPATPTMMNLPKGTQVFSAQMTKQLFPAYADGTGGVWGWLQDKINGFKDGAINFISNRIGNLKSWASLPIGLINAIKDSLFSSIKGMFSSGGGGGGSSAGTAQVRAWVAQAMALTGVAPQWLNALVSLAMHESSGNPRSINLWDSNAKAGHPSKGLFQTIDSTFAEFSLPGHKDIWNPVDNAIAGIRYGISRYGSIGNIPGIRNMAQGKGYVGYAKGGKVPSKRWAWVGENGPELLNLPGGANVFSNKKSNDLVNKGTTLEINYKPTIIIEGNADEAVVQKALRSNQNELKLLFQQWLNEFGGDKKRLSFN